MMNFRTDLACELRDEAMKNYAESHRCLPDGIRETKRDCGGNMSVEEIEVMTDDASRLLGKPIGKYITVSFDGARDIDYVGLCRISDEVSGGISGLMESSCKGAKSALFCGLGNRLLSADAIGPAAADKVIVTHHIKRSNPEIYEKCGFFDVCAVVPGVTAQTGIEAYKIIKSAVECEKPDLLIVCDALAARETSRLAKTIQLSDSGICPGSGVGGNHAEISRATVGVPVISLGVPTVVDASTLARDILSCSDESQKKEASSLAQGLFVSPKDIDVISERLALIIALAVNRALHGKIPYEEMMLM